MLKVSGCEEGTGAMGIDLGSVLRELAVELFYLIGWFCPLMSRA